MSMRDESRIQKALKVFSLFIDDLIVVVVVLWIMPLMGFSLSPPIVIAIVSVLVSIDVVTAPLFLKDLRRRPVAGSEALVGMRGRVVRRLDPVGYVKVNGELWRAVSASRAPIDRGTVVEVIEVRGSTLVVVPVGNGQGFTGTT